MKLYSACIACQIQVRYRDVVKVIREESMRLEAMTALVNALMSIISTCGRSCNPTMIATALYRVVKRLSGVEDPYLDEKIEAHKKALSYLEAFRRVLQRTSSPRDKLLLAMKVSLAANALDVGVQGYVPPPIEELSKLALSLEVYGNLNEATEIIQRAKKVVVLLDNAGEAVMDRLLAEVLRERGVRVYAAVKGGPFQNDVTVKDAPYARLEESFDGVVSTGTDASSVFLEEASPEMLQMMRECDLVISKGMANYEYLSEVEEFIGKPIIYLLVAKCQPIATETGIPLGKAGVVLSKMLRGSNA